MYNRMRTKRQTKWSNSKICTEVKITENEPPLLLCCTCCCKYVVQATFNSLFWFLILLSWLPAHILHGTRCNLQTEDGRVFRSNYVLKVETKFISFHKSLRKKTGSHSWRLKSIQSWFKFLPLIKEFLAHRDSMKLVQFLSVQEYLKTTVKKSRKMTIQKRQIARRQARNRN